MALTPHNKRSPHGRRALANYVNLGRTAMESHYRMAVDNLPQEIPYPTLGNFDAKKAWAWLRNWVKATYKTDIESIFVPADARHAFDPYPATGEQGHYDLTPLLAADGSIRISLAGDWGTGTDQAAAVADGMIANPRPELTIHLGDVYYVGEAAEVEENCLGHNTAMYRGVTWPKGTKGSFALNGNHEMYSGGHGYFEVLLPTLGIPTSQDKQQLRSYFCLEAPSWRILAIDTGYNSDTVFGDCKLDDNLIHWLRNVVAPAQNPKPTVLLSHHQWFSAFGDGNYEAPASQMVEFLPDQEFVWLWGHEHRLSIYDKFKGNNGLRLYARCIGHGGMPVEFGDPGDPTHPVELYDSDPKRRQTLDDGTVAGLNGYVRMTINGPELKLEYFDVKQELLFTETFKPGGGAGAWDKTLARNIVNPGILKPPPPVAQI
jgi:Calcineurin-like phosphoesterase